MPTRAASTTPVAIAAFTAGTTHATARHAGIVHLVHDVRLEHRVAVAGVCRDAEAVVRRLRIVVRVLRQLLVDVDHRRILLAPARNSPAGTARPAASRRACWCSRSAARRSSTGSPSAADWRRSPSVRCPATRPVSVVIGRLLHGLARVEVRVGVLRLHQLRRSARRPTAACVTPGLPGSIMPMPPFLVHSPYTRM